MPQYIGKKYRIRNRVTTLIGIYHYNDGDLISSRQKALEFTSMLKSCVDTNGDVIYYELDFIATEGAMPATIYSSSFFEIVKGLPAEAAYYKAHLGNLYVPMMPLHHAFGNNVHTVGFHCFLYEEAGNEVFPDIITSDSDLIFNDLEKRDHRFLTLTAQNFPNGIYNIELEDLPF